MPRATHCPVQKGAMGTKWQMLVKQVGEDAAWKNWTAYNGFPATFKPSADLKKELGWGQDMSLDSRNRLISRVNQYNQRNNTSHQVINVQHPNNPGRWNPELNINYLPYSNDKLQELIRKTYKDNTLVYSSDEFTKLQYSPVKPKAPSLFDNPAFQKVDYQFKSAEKILANLSKIKQWEKVVTNPPMIWEKIQKDLQIPKEQLELIKNSEGKTVEEKLTNFLSNYSYTVEINTAKQAPKRFNNEYLDADELIGHLVNGELVERSENSQYYSNLTVPGGTNYTENEISTPLITPSIKGHAQYATSNGIGWFRSDEQVVGGNIQENYNSRQYDDLVERLNAGIITEEEFQRKFPTKTIGGENTKTRRILEVQSDLFQKWRNNFTFNNTEYSIKKDNNKNKHYWKGNIEVTANEYSKDWNKFLDTFDSTEDTFTKLLQKEDNWVTFFIKSIIQDSAKKGYEKVLFPTGNTASKIEGHSTLEEFKKQKENRIKELEKDIIDYTKDKENASKRGDKEQVERSDRGIETRNNEINQLKQELERVETEGFGALKPIYNFYENTVTNILKKQYGKENVKQIIDEYGNTWNEVEIKPEHSQTIAFQKGQSKIQPVINISKGLTAKMGVWHAFITPEQAVELSDGQWNGEAGFYHNGNVYLVDGFIDEDTQIHEFAHPLVRSLMLNNPDVADSLWFQFLEHEEGINILNDVERLYPENFDKDGNPNAAAIEEMLVRAITHEAMKGKKYTGFSKVVRDILKAILDAFHSIFGKEVVDITELKTNTTIKDLAKLMTDDSKIELHRDWYADKNDPSFVRAIEHGMKYFGTALNYIALDYQNRAIKKVQMEADQRYEDKVNDIQKKLGKRIAGLIYKDLKPYFDEDIERTPLTAHLSFWQFQFYQHGFNGQLRNDIQKAENKGALINVEAYTPLRFATKTYNEFIDGMKHSDYNKYLIEQEYKKYQQSRAICQKIEMKWVNQQALQEADPAEIGRDIIRLERLGEKNSSYMLQKLRQVQITQWMLARMKKENSEKDKDGKKLSIYDKRMRGTAATDFFHEILSAEAHGDRITDIDKLAGRWQSYVFFSAAGQQMAQQLIQESTIEARNKYHIAERILQEKIKAIKKVKADIGQVITELPDEEGVIRRYFLSKTIQHSDYKNDKLESLQKLRDSGDKKAIALLDFLSAHNEMMNRFSGFTKSDLQKYAVPENIADWFDILTKYTTKKEWTGGIKNVFYSVAEKNYYLDKIVVEVSPKKESRSGDATLTTPAFNMELGEAKKLIRLQMKTGVMAHLSGAILIKTLTHQANLILQEAKANPDKFTLDKGRNIVSAPRSEAPLGATFTPNKYRVSDDKIGSLLINYYRGLFYKNSVESNLPAIIYAKDYYGKSNAKQLETLIDHMINFRVYGNSKLQTVDATTGMVIEFFTALSIWNKLGFNYRSIGPNIMASQWGYFKNYGFHGYTGLAYKLGQQSFLDEETSTVKGKTIKNPFKNLLKLYRILDNMEVINLRGNVSLSVSTKSLDILQKIVFVFTSVTETMNQMPYMSYNIDNKYYKDYDADGILKEGKEGIPLGLTNKVQREVMLNNGPYSDAAKGVFANILEYQAFVSLRRWAISAGIEAFGKYKVVNNESQSGFITGDLHLFLDVLDKIRKKKYKQLSDIPGYQRVAVVKTTRVFFMSLVAMYMFGAFDDDEDKEQASEIAKYLKESWKQAVPILDWSDAGVFRIIDSISPVLSHIEDWVNLVLTSHTRYKSDSPYGKGESKEGADDGDLRFLGNLSKVAPFSRFWKDLLKEKRKKEKQKKKDDGPLMLQPIEPIEPVTMEPISNEDE